MPVILQHLSHRKRDLSESKTTSLVYIVPDQQYSILRSYLNKQNHKPTVETSEVIKIFWFLIEKFIDSIYVLIKVTQ